MAGSVNSSNLFGLGCFSFLILGLLFEHLLEF